MMSDLFLGMSLLGAEWVLYLLVALSILSIGLIIERYHFYRNAQRDIAEFREKIRKSALSGDWKQASKTAQTRSNETVTKPQDFETPLSHALLDHSFGTHGKSRAQSTEVLSEVADEAILRTKVNWEKNLAVLATIGSNAPFVGLFGTVLGIIQAFHEIANNAGMAMGANKISSGLSDALIATAVGILVAIPAAAAFNLFQRKVKTAVAEAEALKSFLIGKIASEKK